MDEPKPRPRQTFKKLHRGTRCNCTDRPGVTDIPQIIFVCRIWGLQVGKYDFLSQYERKLTPSGTDCNYVCKFRGVSMDRAEGLDEEAIKQKYITTIRMSPSRLPSVYCKYKISPEAGKMFLPEDPERTHCNLFKCDQFSTKYILVIEATPLVENVQDQSTVN